MVLNGFGSFDFFDGVLKSPPLHFEVTATKRRCCLKGGCFFHYKKLRFVNQPNKRSDKWESRGVG